MASVNKLPLNSPEEALTVRFLHILSIYPIITRTVRPILDLALSTYYFAVILACRSIPRGQSLKTEIQSIASSTEIDVMELDLSSLDSVRNFSTEFLRRNLPLHVLINNAGIFSMASPREETIDGFESHLGTNHLGHFLLSLSLFPALRAASTATGQPSRIVNVSSRLHLMGSIRKNDPNLLHSFSSLTAYAQSKLAQVICANELTKRTHGEVLSVSLHPGECTTDVVRSLPGPIQKLYRMFMSSMLLTPEEGARCTVHCATSPDISNAIMGSDQRCLYYDSNCTLGHAHGCTKDNELSEWLWQWSVDAVQAHKLVHQMLLPEEEKVTRGRQSESNRAGGVQGGSGGTKKTQRGNKNSRSRSRSRPVKKKTSSTTPISSNRSTSRSRR